MYFFEIIDSSLNLLERHRALLRGSEEGGMTRKLGHYSAPLVLLRKKGKGREGGRAKAKS